MKKSISPLPDNILRCMRKSDREWLGKAGLTKAECAARYIAKSEKQIQSEIANLLRIRAIPFCNPRMDKKSGIAIGWPDFSLVVAGVPVALEVKAEGQNATDQQIETHLAMRNHGWHVYVVRSLQEARERIDEAMKFSIERELKTSVPYSSSRRPASSPQT